MGLLLSLRWIVVWLDRGKKGEFSNYKFHNIRHKLHLATGLEWSPNSRFLYISSSDSLFQYDTWGRLGRFWKLVDIWDGSNDPFKTVFAKMQLGPDCRIYMSSLSSTKSIHVINNPDEPTPLQFCTTRSQAISPLALLACLPFPITDWIPGRCAILPLLLLPKMSLMFLY